MEFFDFNFDSSFLATIWKGCGKYEPKCTEISSGNDGYCTASYHQCANCGYQPNGLTTKSSTEKGADIGVKSNPSVIERFTKPIATKGVTLNPARKK